MIDRRPGARRVLVPLLVALAIAAAAAGCRRRAVELDRDRVAAEVPRRLAAAIRRPDVAVRLEGLVAAAVADPAVQAAGDALVARLQADPAVRAAFASFLATLDEHPRLGRDLAAIARDRPDATPDEIGDLAEQRMEAAMSRRSFHAAVGRAWGEVLASPEVSSAWDRLGARVAHDDDLLAAALDGVDGRLDGDRTARRLTELAGGAAPDRARATDLLLDHAFGDDRLARFWEDLLALPSVERGATSVARALAASPAFQDGVVEAARTVLRDPALRARLADLMAVLLSDDPDEAEVDAAVDAMVRTTVVRRAVARLVARILADQALGAAAHDALASIAHDGDVHELLAGLLERW